MVCGYVFGAIWASQAISLERETESIRPGGVRFGNFGFCFRIATQWQKYGFDLGSMGLEPCNYYYNNFIQLGTNRLRLQKREQAKKRAE